MNNEINCQSCGVANPVGSKFCSDCGKSLSIASTSPPAQISPPLPVTPTAQPPNVSTFKAKYLGGHGAHPIARDVNLHCYNDHLEIPELQCVLPYHELLNVQSMSEKQVTAARILLTGIFAWAWKKRKDFLILTYNDAHGMLQNPVFDVAGIASLQPYLYQQMVNMRAQQQ